MARNFFKIFTENNGARGDRKKYNISDVNRLSVLIRPHPFFTQRLRLEYVSYRRAVVANENDFILYVHKAFYSMVLIVHSLA